MLLRPLPASATYFLPRSIIFILVVMACSAPIAADQPIELPETISFNAHIRPIMSDTCFTCHGPDEEENPSGMRLDSFDFATEEAIVPGDAKSSPVFERISDKDDPMPPAEFRHQLTDYEKALFEKWIDEGAKYQQHWSWAPLTRPEAPATEVVTPGDDRKKQPSVIDQFIQRRLAVEKLEPSPVADRRTLLRRLSLDLIGLPPTPKELDEFEKDNSDDAWGKQVDRLLASPHYGERMAPQWLDIVRFSDTVGFHGDQNQNNFAYRDYVIDAFNNNMPFDQFTIEQLAGDLLDNPTEQQLIATGLVRLNMMTREGGAQPGEYLAKYTADRVRMLGTAWLGTTTGCCECHNHKYDPLTSKDFYSLGAYFDDLRQWGVYTTYGYTPNKDLQGFNNNYPFPPEIRFLSKSLQQQVAYLESHLETKTAEKMGDKFESEELQNWLTDFLDWRMEFPDGWKPLRVGEKVDSSHPKSIKNIEEGQIVTIAGPAIKGQTFTLTSEFDSGAQQHPITVRTLRLEVLPDSANKGYVGRAGDGRFRVALSARVLRDGEVLVQPEKEIQTEPESQTEAEPQTEPESADKKETKTDAEVEAAEPGEPVEIEFTLADRDAPMSYQSGRPPLFIGDVWQSGPAKWQLPVDEAKEKHTAWYRLKKPLTLGPKDKLVIKLKSDNIGKFRLAISPLARFSVRDDVFTPTFKNALEQRSTGGAISSAEKNSILSAWYWATTPADKVQGGLKKIRDEIIKARSGYALTTIAQTIPGEKIKTARVLGRGNWQDESGEEVLPATPAFLPGHVADDKQKEQPRQTRMDLAKWLVSKENPLVARHYVNRTWKHFFGKGLSGKLDDLGNQGEWPSHPELLDWLAADFQSGWDMKALTRQIVNSHAYRQAAAVRSDLTDIDAYNRLLSQQSARRLEAEAVRDNALAISGLLEDSFVGGPSVFPYQPNGHYSNIQFPPRTYTASRGPLQYRRGVYMHWQRSFLHPMLVNFDAPSRDECVADRIESNSPQQALTLLNDPTFVEAARAMAIRIQKTSADDTFESILDRGFLLAVGRSANGTEKEGLQKVFTDQIAHYRSQPEEAQQLNKNGNMKTPANPSKEDQAEAGAQLAAWTQVCRVILNLHETITRY